MGTRGETRGKRRKERGNGSSDPITNIGHRPKGGSRVLISSHNEAPPSSIDLGRSRGPGQIDLETMDSLFGQVVNSRQPGGIT